MKKTYIAPQMEVVELDVVSMIATSEPKFENAEDSEGGMEGDANRRRGEWGNLWQ